MKLNYDFYTFSPKHFKKLYELLNDYPCDIDSYEMISELVRDLAEKGKVTMRVVRGRSHYNSGTTFAEFIKFWPHPKHIAYFRQFDKKKLILK